MIDLQDGRRGRALKDLLAGAGYGRRHRMTTERQRGAPRRRLDDVEQAIEAMRLTIGITNELVDDQWFGERARSRIIEGQLELATLEAELSALRSSDAIGA
jgi:hypothetical protein